jgi:hypothetical protein
MSELNSNLTVFRDHFERFDTAAEGGSRDGIVSREDLQAVANDASGRYSQEERDAAIYLLNNRTAFALLDTGGKWSMAGVTDGKIGRDDVKAVFTNQPKFQEAATFASDGALIPRDVSAGSRDPVEAAQMLARIDQASLGNRDASRMEFTRLVSEHRDDPRWLQDFFRSLGAKNTANYLSDIADPSRIVSKQTADLVHDEVAMLQRALEQMYASGALKDADVACLVEQWSLEPGRFNTGVAQMFTSLSGPHAQELQNAFFESAAQLALGSGAGAKLGVEDRSEVAAAGAFVLSWTSAENQVRELMSIKDAGGGYNELSRFITLAMGTKTRTTAFFADAAGKARPESIRYEGAARLVATLSRIEAPRNGAPPGPWSLHFSQLVKLRDAVFYGAANGLDANKDQWQNNTALKDSLSKIFMTDYRRMVSDATASSGAGLDTSAPFAAALENFTQNVLFTAPPGELRAQTSEFLVRELEDVVSEIKNPNMSNAQFERRHGVDKYEMSQIVGGLLGHISAGLVQATKVAGDTYAERKARLEFAIDLLFALGKDIAKIAPGGNVITKALGFSEAVSALKDKGVEALKKLGSSKVAEGILEQFPGLRPDEKLAEFMDAVWNTIPGSLDEPYKPAMKGEYTAVVGGKQAAQP